MAVIQSASKGIRLPTIIQSGGISYYPLDLVLVDNGGSYTGTFYPGTINGLLPSNYLALTIPKTGTNYIILDVTLANAQVQTAVFSTSTSAPEGYPVTETTPPTNISILTHVVIDGAIFRVIGNGSQQLTPATMFYTDKTSTIAVGERPVIPWFSYTLTTTS